MTPEDQRATRQRVIIRALDARPELAPADLLRLLRKLDLPLTPPMLAEDLKAIGVVMESGPDGAVTLVRAAPPDPDPADGGPAEPTSDRDTSDRDGSDRDGSDRDTSDRDTSDRDTSAPIGRLPEELAPRAGAPVAPAVRFSDEAVAVVAADRASGVDDEPIPPVFDPFAPKQRSPRWGPIVLIVAGLIAIAVSIVGWLGTEDPARVADEGPRVTAGPVDDGPVVAPTGPGADPELFGRADGADSFERGGAASAGLPWEVVGGVWEIGAGQAVLAGPTAGAPSVVVTELASPDVRAQVQLVAPVQGAGLVFRARDARNYWLWAATPGFRTFTLYEVVDGVATPRGDSGITEQGPGVRIGVVTRGSSIELLANGAVVHRVSDRSPDPGAGVGLGALPEVTTATFDEFAYRLED